MLADTVLAKTVDRNLFAPSGAAGWLVSDFTGGITDMDAGAAKGIAIEGADQSLGTWYYTTDGGSTWAQVGAVSSSSALLLANNASTRLYFDSELTTGTVTAGLSLRAWDQTSGTAGSKVNITATGSETAFSAATDTVAITTNTNIDLGSDGKLIMPVTVEGKTYYHWDRNGNGVQDGDGDRTNHNVLDAIFKDDIIGMPETTENAVGAVGDTDNTYRYATLSGVKVALPTIGAGAYGELNGTAVSSGGQDNPTPPMTT